ncbi:MAG TPA: lytic transglycosylase domain-containing protein [Myxococcota bacterium]|nr:lytic transglycosylase domain-containing protein [Myxococcota bacterium]
MLAGTAVLHGAAALASEGRALRHPSGLGPDGEEKLALATALRAQLPNLDPALGARIADSVVRCQRDQSLAPDLVLAVLMQESSGRPGARSPRGAIGLMQVMPYMYQELAMPGSVSHVEANIEAGCRLLADNIRRLGEDDGISAYYWGSSAGDDRYLRHVQKLRRDIRPYLSPERSGGRISG